MEAHTDIYDEITLKNQGTGSQDTPSENKIIIYPFDKYEVVVTVSPTNKFIGITEIRINKDFLSHKQKMISVGFHDVEKFYPE